MAAWIPFREVPLSPDEAGFWMLAQQWHAGPSLYGHYWVDRPPLLLWVFSLAGHLPAGHGATGLTAPGLKALGALASGLSVVLAGVIARLVAPQGSWGRSGAVVVAVGLIANPLLGMPQTSGEILALPFVLAGLACLVAAVHRQWAPSAALLTTAAGALAACAALIKQNFVDVGLFAVVLLIGSRGRVSRLGGRAAAFVVGAALALGSVLVAAAQRGTSPAALWEAVVLFRFQASAVIGSSASSATSDRLLNLLTAAFASGVVPLLLASGALAAATLIRRRGRRTGTAVDLQAPLVASALALTVWELFGVVGGGSYWLHYLTGLVPGLVLLVALVRPSPRGHLVLRAVVAWTVVAGGLAWLWHAAAPPPVSDDARVVAYLRRQSRPGDGVVVTFGHPNIVAGSGLNSPYQYLWSLPARVRDPRLTELSDVLSGGQAPRWVVVAGESIDTWGVDATTAQQILEENYGEQTAYGDWHVWKRKASAR